MSGFSLGSPRFSSASISFSKTISKSSVKTFIVISKLRVSSSYSAVVMETWKSWEKLGTKKIEKRIFKNIYQKFFKNTYGGNGGNFRFIFGIMVVERTKEKIIVELSASVETERIQEVLDWLRYLELTSKSTATQEEIDELSRNVNSNWWNENKVRLTQ